MIGHPSETLEDVQAIADLCKRVFPRTQSGRHESQIARGCRHVRAQTADAIPMGFSGYRESIIAKQKLLKNELKDRNIKLSWTDPEDTLLEAWLTRGDRRMAEVIYSAWKNERSSTLGVNIVKHKRGLMRLPNMDSTPAFYTIVSAAPMKSFPWDCIERGTTQKLFVPGFSSIAGRQDPCGLPFELFRLRHPAGVCQHAPRKSGEIWKCPEVKSPAHKSKVELPVFGD